MLHPAHSKPNTEAFLELLHLLGQLFEFVGGGIKVAADGLRMM